MAMDAKNYRKYQMIAPALQAIHDGRTKDALEAVLAYLEEFDPNWHNASALHTSLEVEDSLNYEQIATRLQLSKQTVTQIVRALFEGGLELEFVMENRSYLVSLKKFQKQG